MLDKSVTFTNLHRINHYIKKKVYSPDIKVFNSFQQSTNNLSDNPKQFKSTLKKYL